MEDPTRGARFLAYVLRHRPDDLGLTLDPCGGWVKIETLLEGINRSGRFARPWSEEDLRFVVQAGARRFLLEDGRICARRGHSVPGVKPVPRRRRSDRTRALSRESGSRRTTDSGRISRRGRKSRSLHADVEPPELLFLVCGEDRWREARESGFLSTGPGRLLSLTTDSAGAERKARKTDKVLLAVEAHQAFQHGARFWMTSKGVFHTNRLGVTWLHAAGGVDMRQRSAGCVLTRRQAGELEFVLIRTVPRELLAGPHDSGGAPRVPVGATDHPFSPPKAVVQPCVDVHTMRPLRPSRTRPTRTIGPDGLPAGRLELPKGKIEKGENPREAALRELREETGILAPVSVICSLPSISYVFRGPAGVPVSKTVVFYLVHSDDHDPLFQPRGCEGIVAVDWFKAENALQRVAFENLRPILRAARDLAAARVSA